MGKKIPAKKHHGVKDPEKQREQRMAKLKMKINETPTDLEQQEIPKTIKRLFQSQKGMKKKRINLDSLQDKKDEKLTKVLSQFLPQRPLKDIPKLTRKPGETDRDFLWRTELTTRNYLNKSKYEDKYDVDLVTDKVTGDVQVKKRDWSYLDDGIEDKPKTKKEKKMLKQKVIKEEKLKAKKEKFKEKKLKKKNKNKNDVFEHVKQDKVEFGEVVQEPPQLTAKPRKHADSFAQSQVISLNYSSFVQRLERISLFVFQPGKRDLLLKSFVQTNQTSNLSGKRKDLSALDRQRLEEERQRAVALYREIQDSKRSKNDSL